VSERSELKHQLAEASERVEQLQQYCDRLTAERENAHKLEAHSRSEARGGSALLSNRLIEARRQITELETEKAALLCAKEEVDEQLQQLKEQLEAVLQQAKDEQAEGLGREDSLRREIERLKAEMSEGALGRMADSQQALQEQVREREAELQGRTKELEQGARERRRLEDLLKDKERALEQTERQAAKLKEKAEKSDARRDEAARELAHTEAAYRAVQEQLEQRFTKSTRVQEPPTQRRLGPLWTALGGILGGMLIMLAAQHLGRTADDEPGSGSALSRASEEPPAAPVPSPATLAEGAQDETTTTASPTAANEAAPPPEPLPPAAGTNGDRTPVEPAAPPPSVAAVKPAPARQQTLASTVSDGGPVLVAVPGGAFRMGYDKDALAPEETPVHQVQISPFYISRDEVTFAEYDRFARATGRSLPDDEGSGRGPRPVVNVSWKEAQAYVAWLSRQTGKRYRLPSEAEWEYAARAGTEGFFWWGYEKGIENANCFDCGSQWDNRSTAPVGSFGANPFGLRDTAGNVMEWVTDCYHANYHGAPTDGSAWTSGACDQRVARGGAFNKPATSMHVSRRSGFAPDARLGFLGFRVVREP
jgi:formylglycine-generating enzyme required for sulfatase activity